MANPLGMKPQPIVFPEKVEKMYQALNMRGSGLGDMVKGLVVNSYEAGFDEACITIHATSQFLAKTGQA